MEADQTSVEQELVTGLNRATHDLSLLMAFTVKCDLSILLVRYSLFSDEKLASTHVDLLGVKMDWCESVIE